MHRQITIHELLHRDPVSERPGTRTGILTTDPNVAAAWADAAPGNSFRAITGIVAHEPSDIRAIQDDMDRDRAIMKLSERERELLDLRPRKPRESPSSGAQLIAQTQAAAFERCAVVLRRQNVSNLGHSSKTSIAHLIRMCETGAEMAATWPADKCGRWLGYVQGCMSAHGLLDVDAERDMTRVDFRTAYAMMGFDIPRIVDLTTEAIVR